MRHLLTNFEKQIPKIRPLLNFLKVFALNELRKISRNKILTFFFVEHDLLGSPYNTYGVAMFAGLYFKNYGPLIFFPKLESPYLPNGWLWEKFKLDLSFLGHLGGNRLVSVNFCSSSKKLGLLHKQFLHKGVCKLWKFLDAKLFEPDWSNLPPIYFHMGPTSVQNFGDTFIIK